MANYVAELEELVRFCPHYNGAKAKVPKCIKFKSGFLDQEVYWLLGCLLFLRAGENA